MKLVWLILASVTLFGCTATQATVTPIATVGPRLTSQEVLSLVSKALGPELRNCVAYGRATVEAERLLPPAHKLDLIIAYDAYCQSAFTLGTQPHAEYRGQDLWVVKAGGNSPLWQPQLPTWGVGDQRNTLVSGCSLSRPGRLFVKDAHRRLRPSIV